MVEFLKDLKLMVLREGPEHAAPWKQVPESYREHFKGWLVGVKQESSNSWEKVWLDHHLEYMVFLLDQKLSYFLSEAKKKAKHALENN